MVKIFEDERRGCLVVNVNLKLHPFLIMMNFFRVLTWIEVGLHFISPLLLLRMSSEKYNLIVFSQRFIRYFVNI